METEIHVDMMKLEEQFLVTELKTVSSVKDNMYSQTLIRCSFIFCDIHIVLMKALEQKSSMYFQREFRGKMLHLLAASYTGSSLEYSVVKIL
jgi:hypothetical protein